MSSAVAGVVNIDDWTDAQHLSSERLELPGAEAVIAHVQGSTKGRIR